MYNGGMIQHNKLVRDKIPAICRAAGDIPTTQILTDDRQYISALYDKLNEESGEVRAARKDKLLGELADVLEVIRAIGKTHGYSPAQIETARAQKFQERGGFEDRIFLVNTVPETRNR